MTTVMARMARAKTTPVPIRRPSHHLLSVSSHLPTQLWLQVAAKSIKITTWMKIKRVAPMKATIYRRDNDKCERQLREREKEGFLTEYG